MSLAVWMGGVAMEFNRLVRHDPYRPPNPGREPDPVARCVYGGLLRLVGSQPRVDVVAGTSAGGLNGALLATALVHDKDLQPLYLLWLHQGDMERLLRSPKESDPPSLLEGDAYFLPRLKEAFASVSEGQLRPAAVVPMRLIITTTMITGQIQMLVDELGSTLPDEVHRGEFHFFRGAGVDDDFERSDVADRLALAGRSTASFPGAFEASFVPVGPDGATADPRRPDMTGTADFALDRYVMDGGVLVNKPIKPVMRAIFAQPAAERSVRRVLAYVVPDPGTFPGNAPDELATAPSMRDVVTHVVTLPRVESISADIKDIQEHNRAARSQQQVRAALLSTAETSRAVRDLASGLFSPYLKLRASDVIDIVIGRLAPERARGVGITERVWAAIRVRVATGTTPWLPVGATRDKTSTTWPFGAGAVEHAGITVLDLIMRGMSVARGIPPAAASGAGGLADRRREVHQLLIDVRAARDAENERWGVEANDLVARGWTDAEGESEAALAAEIERWLRGRNAPADPIGVAELAGRAATILMSALPALGAAAEAAMSAPSPPAGPDAATLARMVEGFRTDGRFDPDACMERLADLAIVQYTLAAGMPVVEQQAQFVLVSANTPNSIDPRDNVRSHVKGKVAGIQLSHFGAFYKRSWRANDWMWGRIDATTRLCQLALDPTRLRSVVSPEAPEGRSAADYCMQRIEQVVLPQPDDPDFDAHELLADKWADETLAARAELAFVASEDDPAPPYLEVCARAIARRLQLDLVRTELFNVADAIDHDASVGGMTQPLTQDFLDAVKAARRSTPVGPLTPEQGYELFRRCRVGEEKIGSDVGSDLFIRTSSTAAAVGINALAGKGSGLKAISPITSLLREAVMLIYLVMQSAVSKKKGGFAALMFLLALGGALIAVDILAPGASRVLLYIGVVLVGAGILVAGLRVGAVRLALHVLAWVAIAEIAYLVTLHLTSGHPKLAWLPSLLLILALVTGAMLLGTIHEGPRTRRLRRDS